ncbi:MAG: ribulose-phosphate 3-epimerase [Clostridiales bacterium]|nr:ribulose-phosphate 3-epimerase [Clostridiales bacterium]
MLQVKIAPSILASDFAKMGETVRKLEENGADLIHCDVMDGTFVPPITFGAQMVKSIRPHTRLPLDCHLMIEHPQTQVEAFAEAGADIITVHTEACGEKLIDTMKLIKSHNVNCAAVVNPATPIEELFDAVELADMLLIMSVVPGWGGQKFIEGSLKKIETLREFCIKQGKPELDIEVDGGITEENVKTVINAGANVIVAGSAVFRAADMRGTIARLRG